MMWLFVSLLACSCVCMRVFGCLFASVRLDDSC